MMSETCRWGILGAANIARKNWQSIRNSPNCSLVGVASRDVDRANDFIRDCQASAPIDPSPVAFADYDSLLASPDIDAVYVPLPTGLRKPWVVKAAAAGKHVMCEKPCGASVEDLQEMIAACRTHGVQFMDGVMFMHSDRLGALRESLDDGTSVGKINRITSQFSFRGDDAFLNDNIRLSDMLEPDGCVGDLGWYNIRFALWVMQYQMPRKATGRLLRTAGRSDSGAALPIEFSAELFFDDDVSASFYCSFVTEHQQWANISGTAGHIHLQDFVLPYFGAESCFDVVNAEMDVDGCDFNMQPHRRTVSTPEYSNSYESAQETKMFSTFAKNVLSGVVDDHWPEIALKTQQVMAAVLASAKQDGQVVEL